jgi:hypothetical protein
MKVNNLVAEWVRKREGNSMKDDAFDDLRCPFNYKKELKKARAALNAKLVECVSRPWPIGYRELAKMFGMSPSALYVISKGCKPKKRPGPRRGYKQMRWRDR